MLLENRFLEILMIGAAALIIIGPKDLPMVMRRVGQFVGKMRGMAAEFRASFDELARQSELEELRKEVEALRTTHDSAISQIHASLDQPSGEGFGETTPSFMMPLSPPPPTPVTGGEDFRPASAAPAEPLDAPAPKAVRKPRTPAAKAAPKPAPKAVKAPAAKATRASPAKPKIPAKPKAPAKPRARAAKAAGEAS